MVLGVAGALPGDAGRTWMPASYCLGPWAGMLLLLGPQPTSRSPWTAGRIDGRTGVFWKMRSANLHTRWCGGAITRAPYVLVILLEVELGARGWMDLAGRSGWFR
jgi:hypothetical protein